MAIKKLMNPSHVLIFVEGDTDEVRSSIEDWILDDVQGIYDFLHLKHVSSSLKGINGYQRMQDLFKKARKTYMKGYETKELINALDMGAIRNKRQDVLAPLEEALGVIMP